MTRPIRSSSLVVAMAFIGCGSSNDLPKNLPPLPAPTDKSKAEIKPMPVESAVIEILADDQWELPDAVIANEAFKARVKFALPEKVKLPARVLLQIGAPRRDGTFVIYGEKSAKPQRDEFGGYVVDVELKGVKGGDYTLQAVSDAVPFLKVPLEVKDDK